MAITKLKQLGPKNPTVDDSDSEDDKFGPQSNLNSDKEFGFGLSDNVD